MFSEPLEIGSISNQPFELIYRGRRTGSPNCNHAGGTAMASSNHNRVFEVSRILAHLKTFTKASCPHCLSTQLRQSHRHFYEKPLSLLGIRPLRCLRCYTRSWKFLSSNRLRFQKSPRIPPAFSKTRAVTLSGAMALALTALLIGTSLTLLFAALLRSINHSPKLINAHSVEQRLYSL